MKMAPQYDNLAIELTLEQVGRLSNQRVNMKTLCPLIYVSDFVDFDSAETSLVVKNGGFLINGDYHDFVAGVGETNIDTFYSVPILNYEKGPVNVIDHFCDTGKRRFLIHEEPVRFLVDIEEISDNEYLIKPSMVYSSTLAKISKELGDDAQLFIKRMEDIVKELSGER